MVSVDPTARIFLVNVGVNASHGALRSPIFPDGTFEFLPIPEERRLWSPTLPAYPKLAAYNDPDKTLADYAPVSRWNDRLHDDPEFRTFTYGDDPQRTGRGAGLKPCGPGDYLLFLARLVPHDGVGRFNGEPGFYLIAFFRVTDVLRDVTEFPRGRDFTIFGANAHIRRAAYHPRALDKFWVWKGDLNASQRLPIAVPLDRHLAEQPYLMREAVHGIGTMAAPNCRPSAPTRAPAAWSLTPRHRTAARGHSDCGRLSRRETLRWRLLRVLRACYLLQLSRTAANLVLARP